MKAAKVNYSSTLIAIKVVKEYVKFLEAGMPVEIEALTEYYVKKLSFNPKESFRKRVINEVGKLLTSRIKNA